MHDQGESKHYYACTASNRAGAVPKPMGRLVVSLVGENESRLRDDPLTRREEDHSFLDPKESTTHPSMLQLGTVLLFVRTRTLIGGDEGGIPIRYSSLSQMPAEYYTTTMKILLLYVL